MTTMTEETQVPETATVTVKHESIGQRVVNLLASFGLTITILLFLMVLTFFGTIEQTDTNLHDIRTKFFDSFFFTTDTIPFLPLPGGALLLTLLAVNLFVGGLLRLRRTPSRVGIFIIHIGIAWLLLSGLVEFVFGVKGYVQIFEGESASRFLSHNEWQVTIAHQTADGKERAFVIPPEKLPEPGSTTKFTAEGLPFAVELRGYLRNCRVNAAGHGTGMDGYTFKRLDDAEEPQNNRPGVTAKLIEPGGVTREAMLHSMAEPYVTRMAGQRWALTIERQSWELPFTLKLRKFHKEEHPRTNVPSRFASDVTRTEDNVDHDIHISMNEPMRYAGYTFYQSGWGPQNVPRGTPIKRYFSVFSVGKNPADRGPLYACIVIACGLVYHFIRKLRLHLRSENRRRA